MEQAPFDTRHGWRLYLYPAFRDTYDGLVAEVERLAAQDAEGYRSHPKTKILRRVNDLILEEIPADPGSPAYRQGGYPGPPPQGLVSCQVLSPVQAVFSI